MIVFDLSDASDQQFSTIINEQRATLRLWFSGFNNRWSLDVSIDGAPVLHGQRIVTDHDLLGGLGLGIGVIFAHSESGVEPGRDEIANGSMKLYHTTKDEIDASVVAKSTGNRF